MKITVIFMTGLDSYITVCYNTDNDPGDEG